MKDIPTYMIVIRDNPVSEYYALVTIPRWTECGFNVERFDACTPDKLPKFVMNFSYLDTHKYVRLKIKKKHTPTEMACWYSHMSLWKRCIELNTTILVIEHDCYPFRPSLIDKNTDLDFVAYDPGGLGCYTISPKLAAYLWNFFVEQKKPIDIGPYGFIHETVESKTSAFSGTLLFQDQFIPAAAQLHDESVGATIDHFEGTEAEPFKHEVGYNQRIRLVKGKKPFYYDVLHIVVG